MFFRYQKGVAREMLTKGYHDAILSMIQGELGGPVPEYKSDDASAYIAEHLNEPMLKRDLKMELFRVLNIAPAKGRSSKETMGKIILNIDGVTLSYIVKHGLKLGSVHTLAADLFGEPLLDAVLLERFNLAGFILFFGADADICNSHDVTSLDNMKNRVRSAQNR